MLKNHLLVSLNMLSLHIQACEAVMDAVVEMVNTFWCAKA